MFWFITRSKWPAFLTQSASKTEKEVPSLLRALLTAAPGTTKYLVYVHSPVGKISKYECSDVWCHNLELTGPLEPTDQHEYSNTQELYISFVKNVYLHAKVVFTLQRDQMTGPWWSGLGRTGFQKKSTLEKRRKWCFYKEEGVRFCDQYASSKIKQFRNKVWTPFAHAGHTRTYQSPLRVVLPWLQATTSGQSADFVPIFGNWWRISMLIARWGLFACPDMLLLNVIFCDTSYHCCRR